MHPTLALSHTHLQIKLIAPARSVSLQTTPLRWKIVHRSLPHPIMMTTRTFIPEHPRHPPRFRNLSSICNPCNTNNSHHLHPGANTIPYSSHRWPSALASAARICPLAALYRRCRTRAALHSPHATVRGKRCTRTTSIGRICHERGSCLSGLTSQCRTSCHLP